MCSPRFTIYTFVGNFTDTLGLFFLTVACLIAFLFFPGIMEA